MVMHWPFVLLDSTPKIHTLLPGHPHQPAERKRPRPPVENEAGLCERIEATLEAAKRVWPWPSSQPQSPTPSPARSLGLAERVRRQQGVDFPIRLVAIRLSKDSKNLHAPLLYASLIENPDENESVEFKALGERFTLPPGASVCLGEARRWRELGPLRPPGGYRLLLLDPPWHSKSAQRAGCYATSDKRDLLADLVPALKALLAPTNCLIACWVTNNRAVQDFVEEGLFPACGATLLGRWYWVKVRSEDGSWAMKGADPWSPHRKPWEVLILGQIGGGRGDDAPQLLLPERLVVCAAPTAHSCKPPLDGLLASAAPALLGEPHLPVETAWRRLPKFECYARGVRPHWHAAGNEVLSSLAL